MAALILGFEPFQEYDENPSQLVAERLGGRSMAGERVVGRVLRLGLGVHCSSSGGLQDDFIARL
ncbi:MAG: hypothetical protein C4339_01275 [Nitrososphaerota archaeon]